MPERFFRYVPVERASTWERAGWNVISPPLSMRPPLGLEPANDNPIDVVIVEWQRPGQPVEPDQGRVKTEKARPRSVSRWLLAHLLAPPPTIRPRRKRVRRGESVPEGQQFYSPVIPEELSKRSTPNPASLDFRALLEQSLVVGIAGSDKGVSENGATRSFQDSCVTQISSRGQEHRSGQQPTPADTRPSGKKHFQGYWGYWSYPKS